MKSFKPLKLITTKIGSGATPSGGQNAYHSQGISLIRSQNVLDFKFSKKGLAFINDSQAKELESVSVQENDILLNITGDSIARTCIVPKEVLPARVNQHVSIIRCNNQVDHKYVFYYLQFLKPHLLKICGVGGTRNALTKVEIEKLQIGIQKNQKGIGNVLFDIDSKIELNNRINAEFEAIAKSLYDYWFVQFDFPDQNGKPYKASGGKMVWNEELKREIPEEWEVTPLFDAMDVQYGFSFSTSLFNEDRIGNPIVRIRDILENTISTYSSENVDEKYKLVQNDLIIGMDGNFHLNFWDKEGAYLNQRCVRIRPTKTSNISNFQAFFQLSPYIKARENNVSRTTVAHLSDKDLKRLFIISPKNISNYRNTFDSLLTKITTNRLENQKLAELRDWLLPMLMNGQVKVKEATEYIQSPNHLSMAAEPEVGYGEL